MGRAEGNFAARVGTRVKSARLGSGRDEYISLSFVGRRKARRKVERSVASAAAAATASSDMSTGIEGKYLKLGNNKADATEDEVSPLSGKEDALTRMLLNG